MIQLDTANKSLEVVLSGAVTTNEAVFTTSYVDVGQTDYGVDAIASNDGATNGATAVTMVSAPASDTSRQVKYISIYNADTVAIDVTVQLNNNSILRTQVQVSLSVGRTLEYSNDLGWHTVNEAGTIESVLGDATSTDPFADTTNILGISNTGGFVKNTWANIKSFFVKVSDIVDNLTSTDTNKPLSANQGKQLQDNKAALSGGNTFSGVQSFDNGFTVGGGADVLSEYEEGTWTPVFVTDGTSPTVIYSSTTGGFYTRVGNIVFIRGRIQATSMSGGTGEVYVDGLPFTANASNNGSRGAFSLGAVARFPTTNAPRTMLVEPNDTKMSLRASDSSDSRDNLSTTVQCPNADVLIFFSGHYQI